MGMSGAGRVWPLLAVSCSPGKAWRAARAAPDRKADSERVSFGAIGRFTVRANADTLQFQSDGIRGSDAMCHPAMVEHAKGKALSRRNFPWVRPNTRAAPADPAA